ncbi:MAG: DUF2892 domain-containing protein [Geminicoccaceae bacterium]
MTCNVGTIDRALRFILGVVLLAMVFAGPQTPWGWLGLVLIGTAAFRFCPAYTLIGFKTCADSGATTKA